ATGTRGTGEGRMMRDCRVPRASQVTFAAVLASVYDANERLLAQESIVTVLSRRAMRNSGRLTGSAVDNHIRCYPASNLVCCLSWAVTVSAVTARERIPGSCRGVVAGGASSSRPEWCNCGITVARTSTNINYHPNMT